MSLSITNISPSTLQDGDSVTLTGSGFGSSQGSVLIGGVTQSVSAWSDTNITFTAARSGQSMGSCRVDVVGGDGSAPAYTPVATWSAAGGTVGAALSNWYSTLRAVYNSDISGPFGGAVVAKDAIPDFGAFYGGVWINNLSPAFAAHGDTVWFRIYVYAAGDFSFNAESVGPDNSTYSGFIKFIRFENTSGGRYTIQFKVDPATSPARTATYIWGATDEVGPAPNFNDVFSPTPASLWTRGEWHSIEVAIKVSDSTNNNGWLRAWVDDEYLGEVSSVDNVSNGTSIDTVAIGTVWNGGTTQANTLYFDELILTTQTPDRNDAGGRPIIGASRKVADF